MRNVLVGVSPSLEPFNRVKNLKFSITTVFAHDNFNCFTCWLAKFIADFWNLDKEPFGLGRPSLVLLSMLLMVWSNGALLQFTTKQNEHDYACTCTILHVHVKLTFPKFFIVLINFHDCVLTTKLNLYLFAKVPYIGCISTHENLRILNIRWFKILDTQPHVILPCIP